MRENVTSWFIVDCETDGPCPGLYSLVSIGAVHLDRELAATHYARCAPLPGAAWQAEALAVSGTTRDLHLSYQPPEVSLPAFARWVGEVTPRGTKPTFVSDNPAFDFAFVNFYMHKFCGGNPFGFSARRIGDLYAGLVGDASRGNEWKKFRRTTHSHHPVEDARGNAEALLHMVDAMGLKISGLS